MKPQPTNEDKIMWVVKGTIIAIIAAIALVLFGGTPAEASTGYATTTCTYSNPVNLDGALAPDYEYTNSTCVTINDMTFNVTTIMENGTFALFFGFILFFLTMWFIVWFFKKR